MSTRTCIRCRAAAAHRLFRGFCLPCARRNYAALEREARAAGEANARCEAGWALMRERAVAAEAQCDMLLRFVGRRVRRAKEPKR